MEKSIVNIRDAKLKKMLKENQLFYQDKRYDQLIVLRNEKTARQEQQSSLSERLSQFANNNVNTNNELLLWNPTPPLFTFDQPNPSSPKYITYDNREINKWP